MALLKINSPFQEPPPSPTPEVNSKIQYGLKGTSTEIQLKYTNKHNTDQHNVFMGTIATHFYPLFTK